MRKNSSIEEVHAVRDGTTYDQNNNSTFSRVPLKDLERLVAEQEDGHEPEGTPIKLYVADTWVHRESLLNNGVVDISLIDVLGLNQDRFKTTAIFACQSKIDVVVFVVSAENHFTLCKRVPGISLHRCESV